MKKTTIFKTMLVAIVLVLTSSKTWGQTTINFDNAANWVQDGAIALTSYGNHSYSEFGVTVQGTNIMRNTTSAQDAYPGALGTYSLRIGNTAVSKITITIASGGLGEFSFKVRRWDGSPMPDYTVKYSVDGGINWISLSNINGTLLTSSDFSTYSSGAVNSTASAIQIVVQNTGTTERIMIDDFTWTGYTGGGTPVAATPIITPSTNNYTTPQSVSISSSTEGAAIYYTTNGNEPTESSTLYSVPFSVSATTTVKAKAFKSGYTPSSTATATYTFPTEVANIAALRAAVTPGFYKLTGEAVLTLKSANRNAKYIQDNTGAVLIDDSNGKITTSYNLGDGIKNIYGTTTLYNGMLQFIPTENPGAATSTGNTVTPVATTLENMANYPGQLVKVSNVTISDIANGTGKFVASKTYNMNASSTTVLRTQYSDLDYIGANIPTTAQDITGVVLIYNTTIQLVPRSLADMVASVGTGMKQIQLKDISVANGKIVLMAQPNETIEVYNALGQRLVSKQAVEGSNSITVQAKGIMLVKVGNRSAKVLL